MRKITILLSTLIIFIWIGCADYQNETYTVSQLDAEACALIQADSLTMVIKPEALPDSISTQTKIDSMTTNGVVFETRTDSLWSVRFPTDSLFAAFAISTGGIKVLYVSKNINIALFDPTGELQTPLSKSIDMETIANCLEVDPVTSKPVYKITARIEYELDPGYYLLRFAAEKKENFKMVIFNKD